MPRPMKLSDAEDRIALATLSVAWTISGAQQFGRICSTMMRKSLAPMARAASTNSISLTESTEARSKRANRGTEEMPTAIIRLNRPGPSAAAIAMASSVEGTASCTSIRRMIRLSSLPP